MAQETPQSPDTEYEVISRPPGQLHDFPVNVRWEVTRRHPYYLVFWSEAALYHQNLLGDHPAQAILRYSAVLILGAIGVNGEPVSPSSEFAALIAGNPDPAFLAGSVQPMTFRAIVAMLINGLPSAERAVVGSLFTTGGDHEYAIPGDDDECTAQKCHALSVLARIPSATLDSYAVIPLFYVHLGASQRTIVRDMEDQARRWKERRKLGSSKIHTSNINEYLDVWDLREGWTGGGYDSSRELSFAEVSKKLRTKSISTVANRYRSGFEMITGHKFSPDLWWRLFGRLKFSAVFGDPIEFMSASTRHHLQSPVRRPVPDSVVSPQSEQPHTSGIVEMETAVFDDIAERDRLIDLKELIGNGFTDEEIAKRLDIPDPQAVTYFRSRIDDFRSI